MTIQSAIEKAIEGGYDFDGVLQEYGLGSPTWRIEQKHVLISTLEIGFGGDPTRVYANFPTERMLLDPAFWQALGKVKGWDDDSNAVIATMQAMEGPRWKARWHHLIDALAEGKSIEQFFETL